MAKVSAGLLLFRRTAGGPEVLLAHLGGPFFAGKDLNAWGVPKGEVEAGEEPRGSGVIKSFPEIDRAEWFSLEAARKKIISAQAAFLDRLAAAL